MMPLSWHASYIPDRVTAGDFSVQEAQTGNIF